jgi:hypothetical protein
LRRDGFLDSLQSALGVFAQSDVYGPLPPRWHIVMTGQAAHVLIGAALALFRVRASILAMVAVAWVAKEVLGDIPTTGTGNHRPDGPEASHALTIKLDQSGGAAQLHHHLKRKRGRYRCLRTVQRQPPSKLIGCPKKQKLSEGALAEPE